MSPKIMPRVLKLSERSTFFLHFQHHPGCSRRWPASQTISKTMLSHTMVCHGSSSESCKILHTRILNIMATTQKGRQQHIVVNRERTKLLVKLRFWFIPSGGAETLVDLDLPAVAAPFISIAAFILLVVSEKFTFTDVHAIIEII